MVLQAVFCTLFNLRGPHFRYQRGDREGPGNGGHSSLRLVAKSAIELSSNIPDDRAGISPVTT